MSRSRPIATAIAASIGAGLVHLALGPEHLEELGALGWGFYLAAALQLGWAAVAITAVLARGRIAPLADVARSGRVAAAGITINAAILLAWGFARAFGLPAGEIPWVPEAIGPADSICAALEIVVIATLLLRPSATTRRVRRRSTVAGLLATATALVVITAGTAAAVSSSSEHDANHAGPPAPPAAIEPADEHAGVHVHPR